MGSWENPSAEGRERAEALCGGKQEQKCASDAEKLNRSAKSMQRLDGHKANAGDFRAKGRMGCEKQGQEMDVATVRILISVISRIIWQT